ncbi:MAG TPA: PLP-dependent aminotransferase family protein [Ruminococcaceae bacterium]|nr:PLP-dependent aminotransferase family protein [Oscillospiraceae bacterium]
MNYTFSDRISSLKPSAIREILKATSDPSVIPFAAGNPDAAAFPIDEVREISKRIFDEMPVLALQYGITEGYAPLRQRIKEYMKQTKNIGRDFDDIIITSGATQIMDLTTKVFCNFGDTVICETPSFIGSLNCFRSYGCKLKGVPVEADGINVEILEEKLKTSENVKFIYTIPNFQNPSGATMSLEKRKRVYELAKKYGVLILEDNPYGDLRVAGEDVPNIKSFDEDGIVIYAGSFSKVLAPGIRAGYVIAPAEIISKMTVGKQAADTHSTMFTQILVDEWMKSTDLNEHINKIRQIYRRKLNLMCDLIDEYWGGFVKYVRPEGGLFVWCELPESVNMLEFAAKCVENKVAVVPGNAFTVEPEETTNCIRLNFSTPSDEKIVEGMEILKKVKELYV